MIRACQLCERIHQGRGHFLPVHSLRIEDRCGLFCPGLDGFCAQAAAVLRALVLPCKQVLQLEILLRTCVRIQLDSSTIAK